ncbi:hypothetical protein RS84_01808 [Microbacterium hydrocarbonoxydans]|jgi:hypothetical protein|uniref:Antitoxin VbhA domain-containing protein n=1 Tax=Microbacterium hydrocarbonoxydans TaxID=273678 RepID=A0A0M2HN44_9MICO|nr:antitoxin VbhA family protein [Microbacterium hydrocarbonoxydans]KJL48177.1 hypothetical protein RS84_01808 [Microbacterium hydrocarbonoxydans]
MLSNQQKRDLTVDTMGSWALEGMKPEPDTLDRLRSFVIGAVTLDEAIDRAKTRYAAHR